MSHTAVAKYKSWRDVLPVHEAAGQYPRLSDDELVALGEDIRKNGLRQPPVILIDQRKITGRKATTVTLGLALLLPGGGS